jgi:subtilase family serine protease
MRIAYMRMVLKPTEAQSADLERLLEAQRDPSSPDYQRWLTPEEFGERFGVSESDLAQVAGWLRSEGFTVEQTARARNWIAFSGSAAEVSRAFHTEIHHVHENGERHFANASEPSVPAALAGLVGEIRGLDDFRLRPPHVQAALPNYTSGSSHYLAPDDLAAIYDITALYKAGFDGTGQKLVIVGQTDINVADINGFRTQFGLPANPPQLVLYGTDPGVSSGDQVESNLDLEWAGAVARGATIVFVYSQDVMESVSYAIDQNLAPVISMSYGGCEVGVSTSNRTIAQQANAEGITWMNSSGDSGAAGCDWGGPAAAQYGPVVTFPADIPEITAVGGTEFNEGSTGWSATNSSTWQSATGYLPEKAWNDTPSGGGIWASGGGVSAVFPKPWWQSGPGVPADSKRDVPDISLTASGSHDGYMVYQSGSLFSVGGTSASSPSFAGIVAVLNQYVVSKGIQSKAGLGNINPKLYSLAQNTTGVIHDITSGNNIVPCVAKSTGCTTGSYGYTAGTGYDLVTGLGSVDAYNLVTNWGAAPVTVGTTTTVTASPTSFAQSGSTVLTARVSAVTGTNAPTGSVAFVVGSVALGSAALTPSGSTATATLTVKGTSLVVGSDTITANYTASGTFSSSSGTTSVTVTAATAATTTVATATPTSVASTASVQLSATVSAATGTAVPTGTVTFLAGATSLGTGTLNSSGVAALSIAASKLTIGANSITASYAGATGFSSSVSTAITVTVTAPVIATTTKATASAASIAQNSSTTITVTVTPASGATAPAGTVTISIPGKTLATVPLTAAGSSGAASYSVAGTSLAIGANTITASYAGATGFSASSGTVPVTVTAAAVATTTTVTANPTSIASSASTTLTVTVRPASGATAPTGTINFLAGSTSLGSAQLTASGANGMATLSVKGMSLAAGNNTISAVYAGATGFGTSSGSTIVTVAGTTASNVVLTVMKTTSNQQGFPVKVQLQETAGSPTTITSFTINNVNFTPVIGSIFGSTQLAAKATVSDVMVIQWAPLPAMLTFVATGTDPSGRQWSQTFNLSTR